MAAIHFPWYASLQIEASLTIGRFAGNLLNQSHIGRANLPVRRGGSNDISSVEAKPVGRPQDRTTVRIGRPPCISSAIICENLRITFFLRVNRVRRFTQI